MTPHIEAKEGEIAKTVIMPGDPKRAELAANTYLENPRLVTNVRGMSGYTGTYKGKEVTIMASGMGCPSMGIYSYELYKFYGVEQIIRVGSAGAYTTDLNVYDLVLVNSSISDSNYAYIFNGYRSRECKPSFELNEAIKEKSKELNLPLKEGRAYCTDAFYKEVDNYISLNQKHHVLCAEMESFALFANASYFGKKAACILTISDHLVTKESTTSEERRTKMKDMFYLALEASL